MTIKSSTIIFALFLTLIFVASDADVVEGGETCEIRGSAFVYCDSECPNFCYEDADRCGGQPCTGYRCEPIPIPIILAKQCYCLYSCPYPELIHPSI